MPVKLLLSGFAIAAFSFGAATPAFAWGCIAVSDSGTYGYSYSFDNRGDAEDRALDECTERTSEICEIQECVEGS